MNVFTATVVLFFDFSYTLHNSAPYARNSHSGIFFVKVKRDATVLALKSDSLTIALKKNAYTIPKVPMESWEYANLTKILYP
jgi:hypothetical protein